MREEVLELCLEELISSSQIGSHRKLERGVGLSKSRHYEINDLILVYVESIYVSVGSSKHYLSVYCVSHGEAPVVANVHLVDSVRRSDVVHVEHAASGDHVRETEFGRGAHEHREFFLGNGWVYWDRELLLSEAREIVPLGVLLWAGLKHLHFNFISTSLFVSVAQYDARRMNVVFFVLAQSGSLTFEDASSLQFDVVELEVALNRLRGSIQSEALQDRPISFHLNVGYLGRL